MATDGIGPENMPAMLAACEANALEIGACFSRAFDFPLLANVGKPSTLVKHPLAAECEGPGLVMLFRLGDQSAVAMLTEASGMLPAWYRAPDITGRSKLETLALELSMLLFPGEMDAESSGTAYVPVVAAALQAGNPVPDASYIPVQLSAGPREGKFFVVWPITKPTAVLPTGAKAAAPAAAPAPAKGPSNAAAAKPSLAPAGHFPAEPISIDALPTFSRSILRIQVPVMVTLATKKQPVSKIVELLPGSIIQFNKSCEEMLELEVSGERVAYGECVKVGDKFGLRVTSMIMPGERFASVGH